MYALNEMLKERSNNKIFIDKGKKKRKR